ncbi:MAG: T9SS type A sorting domain-containing protein [Bacteroidetes bacterium]|nr:T9SS type A sorting domain-containing protein [Bacteroidota bacterium]
MKHKIIILLFSITFFTHQTVLSQQNINGGFTYNGNYRTYILHIPGTYSGSVPVPLVFNLHGYSSNATQQQFYSAMDVVSDTAGFLVVYPNAVNSVWDTLFTSSAIDDVGFLSALIDTIRQDYLIDTLRIFSCGISMGGYMTYRLACELHDRIAAVASVAGPTVNPIFDSCQNTPPMPVLHFHGTADSTVPYNGQGMWPPVDTIIQYFVSKNGCPLFPDTTPIPDIWAPDNCTVTRFDYSPCDDSSEVVFFKIFNGGHTWPGGTVDIIPFGNTNRDINASVEIWNFFRKHKLQDTFVSVDENIINRFVTLFPNPAQKEVMISSERPILKISVYSSAAVPYHETRTSGINEIILEVSDLPSGFYIVKIDYDKGSEYRKFIRM